MKSPLLENTLGAFPNPIPDPRPMAGFLGTAAVAPGFYGSNWSNTIFLTTNHRSMLVKFGNLESLSLTILALEAGGFPLEPAIALDTVLPTQAEESLANLEKQNPGLSGRILVPHILREKFKWEDGTRIGKWKVVTVPGDIKKLPAFLQQDQNQGAYKEKHLPKVLIRLATGLKLVGGQAILLAIPLFVFGWQAVVIGISALLLSTIFLGLTWKLLPGKGWLKGLVGGAFLALALSLVLFLVVGSGYLLVPGLFLSCFWMGIVFSGTKE